MKERPILFSAPMVRAILEGRKTQTRRIMSVQPPSDGYQLGTLVSSTAREDRRNKGAHHWIRPGIEMKQPYFRCPYGYSGDRLWVREAFWTDTRESLGVAVNPAVAYAATAEWFKEKRGVMDRVQYPETALTDSVYLTREESEAEFRRNKNWRLKPSIHMPRWASRITLEITDVRVQQLWDISPADAIAEGIEPVVQMGAYQTFVNYAPGLPAHLLPRDSFQTLWRSINGEGSWAANPWVWAITFKRLEVGGTK